MIEALPGLIAVGIVATVGFLMVRAFNARRGASGSSSDGSSGYWTGNNMGGPGAADSSRDPGRGESGGWFSGLFGSSDNASSSSDSGSSDGGGGGSDGGGGGGGD